MRPILLIVVLVGMAGPLLIGCSTVTPAPVGMASVDEPRPDSRVVVYYTHRTFRCFSCLWLEKTTRQTLEDSFASELAAGRLEFRVVDYWADRSLAERYGVDTVSVIVVNIVKGEEVSHRTLERLWDLKAHPDELRAYIKEAVRAALEKTG